MTYSEKLKDPRWQKKRLEVFERDVWTCQFCGAKEKTLNVHHLQYERGREPWEIQSNYLLTLCEDCHEFESEHREKFEVHLIAFLRRSGISATLLINFIDALCLCEDARNGLRAGIDAIQSVGQADMRKFAKSTQQEEKAA